ncbi:MAG: hypothetical protein QOJ79_847 [Actinomycetota bacterium]|nr:hypothetical protein [Actinomycetota bacterium]
MVALLCAALSSNVDGTHHTVLLVLTVVWLLIAASCVVNALRTAEVRATDSTPSEEGPGVDPG